MIHAILLRCFYKRRHRAVRVNQPYIPVFEAMVSFLRSMASSLLALPRSCHDLGKDIMAMQDRAKAKHDLGKGSMLANGSTSYLNR